MCEHPPLCSVATRHPGHGRVNSRLYRSTVITFCSIEHASPSACAGPRQNPHHVNPHPVQIVSVHPTTPPIGHLGHHAKSSIILQHISAIRRSYASNSSVDVRNRRTSVMSISCSHPVLAHVMIGPAPLACVVIHPERHDSQNAWPHNRSGCKSSTSPHTLHSPVKALYSSSRICGDRRSKIARESGFWWVMGLSIGTAP